MVFLIIFIHQTKHPIEVYETKTVSVISKNWLLIIMLCCVQKEMTIRQSWRETDAGGGGPSQIMSDIIGTFTAMRLSFVVMQPMF